MSEKRNPRDYPVRELTEREKLFQDEYKAIQQWDKQIRGAFKERSKSVKERLIDKINKDLFNNAGYYIKLTSNGYQGGYDTASWEGFVFDYKGGFCRHHICSWHTMTSLVSKKVKLVWIGNDNFEISCETLTPANQ